MEDIQLRWVAPVGKPSMEHTSLQYRVLTNPIEGWCEWRTAPFVLLSGKELEKLREELAHDQT